jgi:hypothetical protein
MCSLCFNLGLVYKDGLPDNFCECKAGYTTWKAGGKVPFERATYNPPNEAPVRDYMFLDGGSPTVVVQPPEYPPYSVYTVTTGAVVTEAPVVTQARTRNFNPCSTVDHR